MAKKYTKDEVEKLFKSYGLKIVGNEYKNSKTKISAIDLEGYIAYISLESLLANKGTYRKWLKTNPYSIYNINLYMKLNEYGTYTITEEYFDLKKKMGWLCKQCGDIFEANLGHVLNDKKCYCNDCSRFISDKKRRHNIKEVIEDFEEVGLTLLEEYKDMHTCIKCKDKDGFYIYTRYVAIKNGQHNFWIFHPTNPYTIDNIKHYIEINDISVELLSTEYIDSDSGLSFRCSCGSEFKTTWGSFKYQDKYRCDACSKAQSNGEKLVEQWLIKNNFSYEMEYRNEDCRNKKPLPFDFVIFDSDKEISAFIEIDGIQHFMPVERFGGKERFKIQQKLDNIKNRYVDSLGVKMIRIPYWEIKTGEYINRLKSLI